MSLILVAWKSIPTTSTSMSTSIPLQLALVPRWMHLWPRSAELQSSCGEHSPCGRFFEASTVRMRTWASFQGWYTTGREWHDEGHEHQTLHHRFKEAFFLSTCFPAVTCSNARNSPSITNVMKMRPVHACTEHLLQDLHNIQSERPHRRYDGRSKHQQRVRDLKV